MFTIGSRTAVRTVMMLYICGITYGILERWNNNREQNITTLVEYKNVEHELIDLQSVRIEPLSAAAVLGCSSSIRPAFVVAAIGRTRVWASQLFIYLYQRIIAYYYYYKY